MGEIIISKNFGINEALFRNFEIGSIKRIKVGKVKIEVISKLLQQKTIRDVQSFLELVYPTTSSSREKNGFDPKLAF